MAEESNQTFLKEALPSRHYREYQQKQHIQNETLRYANNTIEYKRRLSRSHLDREQKEVTEQFRRMQIEKAMYAHAHHNQVTRVRSLDSAEDGRDGDCTPADDLTPAEEEDTFVNPYPVTIMPKNRNQKLRSYSEYDANVATRGMRYARNRGRRQSKEFEDLAMNTTTGSLLPPFKTNKQTTACDVIDGRCWVGDPEAIHSVRRQRKSVQEQHYDFVFKRSHTSDSLATKTTGQPQPLYRRNTEASRATTPTTARKLSSSKMSNFDSSPGLVRKMSSSRTSIDVCVSPTGAPSLTRKISSTNAHAMALGSNVKLADSPSVRRKRLH
ncbi:uncharacterized protein LOC135488309 [Lineus longissimus]|uniref:uncharacterized protein LOC135488309 n=1 Tax=Lineus longissimus TaxID=88925 RepID=UPI002B4E28FE